MSKTYTMELKLLDIDGVYKSATYSTFNVLDNTDYTLDIDGFATDDKWFIADSIWTSDNAVFITSDNGANGECGTIGGGWFSTEFTSNPFGFNFASRTAPLHQGITFKHFGGFGNSLTEISMALIPTVVTPPSDIDATMHWDIEEYLTTYT